MANNESIIITVISRINSTNLEPEMKTKAIAEVIANPDRADSILEVLLTIEADEADMEAYCDGEALADFAKRESERKAAEAEVARQKQEYEDKLRNAALVNVMGMKNHPVFGTEEFTRAYDRELARLHDGANVCFDPAGGAFVYDMEKTHLSDREREILEEQEIEAATSDEEFKEFITQLPDGMHHFHIVDIRTVRVNGYLKQKIRLEDDQYGYSVWLNWIIDKSVEAEDYKQTRRYLLQKYNVENNQLFKGLTEKKAMEVLMNSGMKLWTYTRANAKQMDDGRKFASVFLTKADYMKVLTYELKKQADAEDRKNSGNETKSGTWKF